MVKIGDKVRFLNAVGGGVVRKFINKEVVSVEEEDGFETPVLIKECVVVAAAGEVSATQAMAGDGKSRVEVTQWDKPTVDVEKREGDQLNVSLAYIPSDSQSLNWSTFDTYLVNDSNYWLMFSYLSQEDGKWIVRYAGMAEPNRKIHLELIKKDDINEIQRVGVQLMAFKKGKAFDLKPSMTVELRLDTVKFYKLNTFVENDYFEEKALIYSIVKNDFAQQPLVVTDAKLEKALKEKLSVDVVKVKPAQIKRIRNGIVEIDLHIDSLIDSKAGMSNRDILEYQLEVFNKTLDEYKQQKGQSIVFIHGKGDGVLRKALLKELGYKYKGYGYQDASFKEYGYGATMVTIK